MAMTTEERQAFFDQYGCWPIEDSDIPDNEKVILTEEQIAEGAIIFAKKQAKQYLANTDCMFLDILKLVQKYQKKL